MSWNNWWKICLSLAVLAGSSLGQNEKPKPADQPEPAKYYNLDFQVKEVEGGKILNSRSYSFILSSDKNAFPSAIRMGSRVPYSTFPGSNQLMEVGVNIDCRFLSEMQNRLALNVTADISGAVPPTEAGQNQTPVLRQTKWSSGTIVTLKKPTVIFSSDDVTTKRTLQLELTATQQVP